MPVALVVGDSSISDPMIGVFKEKCRSLGYDPDQIAARELKPDRCSTADPAGPHLVLFCAPKSHSDTRNWLAKLKHDARRVIVYVPIDYAGPHPAVDYLHEGLAHGYLVNGESSEASMRELITSLRASGQPPYRAISFRLPKRGGKPTVFISTPFERSTMMGMLEAVAYPLESLGFTVLWGDRDYWHSLQQRIVKDIQSSSLLVANISPDARNGLHNANVYFEAGAATAAGVPIVFVRKQSEESLPLPADVQGRRLLFYDNDLDLALKLYCGLKQSIPSKGAVPNTL